MFLYLACCPAGPAVAAGRLWELRADRLLHHHPVSRLTPQHIAVSQPQPFPRFPGQEAFLAASLFFIYVLCSRGPGAVIAGSGLLTNYMAALLTNI